MSGPVSEALLPRLRDALRRRGWNTAALARAMGRDRREIRSVLAGRTPLTVDDFALAAQALELAPQELHGMASALSPEAGDSEDGAPASGEPSSESSPPGGDVAEEGAGGDDPAPPTPIESPWTLDPEGIHGEQLLRMGFALGIDMHLLFDSGQLEGSGVPEPVLRQFPERLPIRLDAAFHPHNKPRYYEDGVELVLSFDGISTCWFPWRSLLQVTYLPEIFEAPAGPDDDPEEPSGEPSSEGGPVLRLVKS